ncbi:APC family permease [Corynebacterium sp. c3Ub_189]|uniref:APC family permease n=1 Tax=Corynebacterium sp. c3Ub_189 TaxID=3032331 RepID=UPI0032655CE6
MTRLGTGRRPRLQRKYKPSWIFALALGAAIGWGAFVLPFDWMMSAGLSGTLLGFVIGGVIITIIAINYGLAIRAMPVTGGAINFAKTSLGDRHSFVVGWSLALGYSCIVALNASAVTLVFRSTFPSFVMRLPLYSVAEWTIYLPEVLIASAFIGLFAWINISDTELSGRFQFYAVLIMLVAVLAVSAVIGFYYFRENPELAPRFPESRSPFSAVLVILAFAPWAYVGFDSIPQLAGEFNFSPKKAMALLVSGTAAASGIYSLMMITTTIAVGTKHELYAKFAWPTATAIGDIMGWPGLLLLVLAVSAGVLTGLNGFYTAASRVIFSLGQSKMLPEWLGRLDSKKGTPKNAVLVVMALCLLTPWFGRSALTWIVDMSSAGVTVAYFYTSYFVWKVGKDGLTQSTGEPVEPNLVWKLFGLGGCLISVGFLLLLFVPGSPGALSIPSLIALIVWVVAGVVVRNKMTRKNRSKAYFK